MSSDYLDDVRPMFELQNRNYVVTGGAQGIGFATSRAICEMGGNVAVLDIQATPIEEFNSLSSRFKVKTVYIQTDVTKEESLIAAFDRVVEILGSINGLVPAAGIAIDKPFLEQTWAEFTRIQEINVRLVPWLLSLLKVDRHTVRAAINSLTGPRHILLRAAGS